MKCWCSDIVCNDEFSSPAEGNKYKSLNPNCFDIIKHVRLKNVKNVIIGTLNINSLPLKFDQVKLLILGNIDILVLTETKLDESFPTSQFLIDGYSIPYRLDRNRFGGGRGGFLSMLLMIFLVSLLQNILCLIT